MTTSWPQNSPNSRGHNNFPSLLRGKIRLRWLVENHQQRRIQGQSLSHSKWACKYHVVFIPKARRKVLFGKVRPHLGAIFHALAWQKECQILEGHLRPDPVHRCIAMPPSTWWHRDAPMHRVRPEMAFENLAFLLPGQRMKNRPEMRTNFPKQNLPLRLRDEHDMVFAGPFRMG